MHYTEGAGGRDAPTQIKHGRQAAQHYHSPCKLLRNKTRTKPLHISFSQMSVFWSPTPCKNSSTCHWHLLMAFHVDQRIKQYELHQCFFSLSTTTQTKFIQNIWSGKSNLCCVKSGDILVEYPASCFHSLFLPVGAKCDDPEQDRLCSSACNQSTPQALPFQMHNKSKH